MTPLNSSELNTLLAMAESCQSTEDAQDTLYLFGLLDPNHKIQLKKSLKKLPAQTRKLLRDAAISQKQGRAAA